MLHWVENRRMEFSVGTASSPCLCWRLEAKRVWRKQNVAPRRKVGSWRNRSEFVSGRQEIVAFLSRFGRSTETVSPCALPMNGTMTPGNWFRSYGNENWEFDENGLMRLRLASINDLSIKETERKYHWALGRRPDDHPGLSDLGF
jgi:nuclear transport factor 2 (NTF2) superfamily protein